MALRRAQERQWGTRLWSGSHVLGIVLDTGYLSCCLTFLKLSMYNSLWWADLWCGDAGWTWPSLGLAVSSWHWILLYSSHYSDQIVGGHCALWYLSPPLDHELHEARDFSGLFSLAYLAQWLAQNKCSINICWVNELRKVLRNHPMTMVNSVSQIHALFPSFHPHCVDFWFLICLIMDQRWLSQLQVSLLQGCLKGFP